MPINLIQNKHQTGFIEVICGCMFSGKTKELIKRIKASGLKGHNIGVFKPSIDVRYHADKIVSHDTSSLEAKPIAQAKEMLDQIEGLELVAIDEAQFFGDDIVEVIKQLANEGKRVIVAGLDLDYLQKPFGPMPVLISIANQVTTLHAVCERCGGEASFTYRKTQSDQRILIGEKNEYEARCNTCYDL